ncbi:MAG: GNAT family N-acetyltransferase [Fibromonadales bacterium]|nr:GNAT family N-acetyltransferase [Fibromonadales bacterium]
MSREIAKATYEDLPEILLLQKLAFQSEAQLWHDCSIKPMTQTLQEIEDEFARGVVFKLMDKQKIVGSIRACEENGRVYIAKLIVHPDYRNVGFGASLLAAVEEFYKGRKFELHTSCRSEKNLYLYRKNGYKEFKREKVSDVFEFVFLEK